MVMLTKKILILLFASIVACTEILASPSDWIKSGNTAIATQNIDHAIFCYTQAIDNDPKDARAYLLRSKAYQLKGEFIKSAEDKKMAFQIDPDNSLYYFRNKKLKGEELEKQPLIEETLTVRKVSFNNH